MSTETVDHGTEVESKSEQKRQLGRRSLEAVPQAPSSKMDQLIVGMPLELIKQLRNRLPDGKDRALALRRLVEMFLAGEIEITIPSRKL